MRDYPHQNENRNENVTVFTGDEIKSCLLLSKLQNSVILDSGCTSNLAGKLWIDFFLETLQACDLNKVRNIPSAKMFRFGRGKIKSMGQIIFPCNLAGKDIFIKTNILDSNILLLLSKQSIKTACFKHNLENDAAEIWGNNIVLDCTTSRHYCILLNINKLEECAFVKNKTIKDELIKINKQFAHPSKAKFKSLLVDTNM